jgi:chaperonin GroES
MGWSWARRHAASSVQHCPDAASSEHNIPWAQHAGGRRFEPLVSGWAAMADCSGALEAHSADAARPACSHYNGASRRAPAGLLHPFFPNCLSIRRMHEGRPFLDAPPAALPGFTAWRVCCRRAPMKIRPLYDRIVATRVPEEEKTAGGLFIPDTAKEKPLRAVVVAVGNGKVLDDGSRQALSVKAGDKILIGKYTGSEVKLDGQEHLILREDDVLAVLDE